MTDACMAMISWNFDHLAIHAATIATAKHMASCIQLIAIASQYIKI